MTRVFVSLFHTYDMQPMGLGTKCEGGVMGGHDEIGVRQVLPEQGSGKMDCVESTKFSRHGLSRPIEDGRVDLYDLEGTDQREERRSAYRHVGVGESNAEAKAIQRTKALGHDQGAGNALVDLPPLPQGVRLAKRDPQQDRRVDVRDHRCP